MRVGVGEARRLDGWNLEGLPATEGRKLQVTSKRLWSAIYPVFHYTIRSTQ